MDLFQHLTTFVRIADTGSISKAARSLRLSVAMVSRHLRGLEQHLGADLMRRTTRRLDLTPAGHELLLRARAILAGVTDAEEAIRRGAAVSGTVVISLPVSFGLSHISPVFPALLAKHPRLELDLRFEDRLVDLLADGVDLAIRAGALPPDSPFVTAKKLATIERVVCASPAFLARYGPLDSVEALSAVPCVIQGPAPARWAFELADGPKVVTVEGRLHTNNVFALRDAALAGLGVARMPVWIVGDDLANGRLVRLVPDAKLPVVDVIAMYHRGAEGSAAVRGVIRFLEDEIPKRMETPTTRSRAGRRGAAPSVAGTERPRKGAGSTPRPARVIASAS